MLIHLFQQLWTTISIKKILLTQLISSYQITLQQFYYGTMSKQMDPQTDNQSPIRLKNNSQFISTWGPDLFKNHSVAFGEKLVSTSYSNLPMKKEVPNWNKSSAVLRHTHHKYTIPKDQRFKRPTINYYNHYQLKYPSTLSNRAASIGIGRKVDIPKVFGENRQEAAKDCPFYELDTDQKLRKNQSQILKKGKTIGPGWGTYENSRAPHRATVHSAYQVKSNPGPKYQIADKTGDRVQKTKMHGRLRMFSDTRAYHKRDEPGPQNYGINESHTKQASSKTSFGYGRKTDFTDNPEFAANPGPVYKLSGFCDKYTKTKYKNLGKKFC